MVDKYIPRQCWQDGLNHATFASTGPTSDEASGRASDKKHFKRKQATSDRKRSWGMLFEVLLQSLSPHSATNPLSFSSPTTFPLVPGEDLSGFRRERRLGRCFSPLHGRAGVRGSEGEPGRSSKSPRKPPETLISSRPQRQRPSKESYLFVTVSSPLAQDIDEKCSRISGLVRNAVDL